MSKIRLISALAGGVCILAAACWMAAGALPLAAQTAPDGAGVSVDLGSSAINVDRSGSAIQVLGKGPGRVIAFRAFLL